MDSPGIPTLRPVSAYAPRAMSAYAPYASSRQIAAVQRRDGSEPRPETDKETPAVDTRQGSTPDQGLSADDLALVQKLAATDRDVRAHEASHQSAGGGLAGAASYSYRTGPDGRRYAVGGEVSIALRQGETPQQTISNMRQVQAAALAPADPSSQDVKVAAEAARIEAKAHIELARPRERDESARKALAAYRSPAGPPADNVGMVDLVA